MRRWTPNDRKDGQNAMKQFFMIANPKKAESRATARRIVDYLEQAGAVCHVQDRKDAGGGEFHYTDANRIPKDTECILVLGGDGTLIEAARDTAGCGIPLIGINLGTLGFLAEVEVSHLEGALKQLLSGQVQLEKRMMLKGKVLRNGDCRQSTHALNDIVITRRGSLHILNFRIYVNGQFLNAYSADGVIVSTPTGSTGYNMSAGGPIVEPKAGLMVITPICPHTLNTRSIVLAPEDEVSVAVSAGKDGKSCFAEVDFDGGHAFPLEVDDVVRICRSENTTDIVKLNQVSFLEVLHKKMSEK